MRVEILVTADQDETRAAVLEDGVLVEFYVERPLLQRTVGNIYKGKVENVLPGMQAAFVDIGLDRNAFLYVADAHPLARVLDGEGADLPEDLRHASIKDLVRPGQEIVVQVEKEPVGTKGARVTRHLTVPGRFLVLVPGLEYVGVSRKLPEAERERLRQLAATLRPPGHGLIVRTAAAGCGEPELRRDVQYLLKVWAQIQARARTLPAPALVYRDPGLVHRLVRDLFTEQVDRFVVDSREHYQQVMELLDGFAPELKSRVEFYTPRGGALSVFDAYGINEELERALRRKVWLKSGGYLVIDQTEALTVIDVNTGKFVGSTNLQDTVLRTNLEAAGEVARQLRLRDIGGIIIVDFIDMDAPKHRRRVLQALEEALQRDRMRGQVLGITQLGLVEITRKKSGRSLLEAMTQECPYCDGRGRVFSAETMARRVRREIRRILRGAQAEAILVEVNPAVASLVIGAGGAGLRELERETGRSVFVRGSEDCHLEDVKVRALGSRQEVEALALPVRAGQVLDLRVEEPHASNRRDGIARVHGYVIDIEGAGDRVGQILRVEITRAYRTYAKARIVADAATAGAR